MAEVDAVIEKYATKLQDIYDNETAGDYTFVGVLSAFLREAITLQPSPFKLHWQIKKFDPYITDNEFETIGEANRYASNLGVLTPQRTDVLFVNVIDASGQVVKRLR